MGAWGTALFSDDVTCDVRDAYRERIAAGMDGPAATDDLLKQWKVDSCAPIDDDVILFWLALAATQWKVGRLEDRVQARALEIIDSGEDLKRWEAQGPKPLAKRLAVLQQLKQQLQSPQPPAKKVRVERLQVPAWSCGDYVTYRLKSGRNIILYVEGVIPENNISCSVLDWVGDILPDDVTILGLSKRISGPLPTETRFSLFTMKKRGIPYDRLTLLSVKNPLAKNYTGGGYAYQWESFDYHLDDNWGLQ